ncbi:MAG: hypothetical protein HOW97_09495 [Catenulispora sp.]|nr:hypothetical protein [Catenulispora sp.]
MTDTPADEQQPAYRCAHCPRLLRNNELHRQVCRVCEDRATEQVQALPALYRQLETVLQPSRSGGSTGRTPAGRTAPLPVALQPLNLRGPGGIVSMLLGIEQRWRIALDWTYLPQRGGYEPTLDGTTAVIVNNLPWACDQYTDIAADLMLIGSLHTQAVQAVTGERDVRVPVGACPVIREDTGVACAQPLKVSPWASAIRCTGCGTSWRRDEWLWLGAVIRGLPAPVAA